MKYRIDFVTNSSSSSSVVVRIKTKNNDHYIKYDVGIYTEGFNAIEPKYNQIIGALITAKQIEIISKFDLIYTKPKLVEISGLNNVGLFREEIEKYIQANRRNSLVEPLKQLIELEDINKLYKASSYEDFLLSPIWGHLKVDNPSSITLIEELIKIDGDDYKEKFLTKVDPINLKIIKKSK
jgi:hypothetical protein